MYTLYIDTHAVDIVLALFSGDTLLDENRVVSSEHSKNTIPLLESLLKKHNILVSDLNEIIVITGPGSFTGVRIGIVIAKMIGFNLNVPIKGISYLEAMAIKYNREVLLGVKDKNGVFVGEFDKNHNLLKYYYYLSNQELEAFDKDIIIDDLVNISEVKFYLKDKDVVSPHLLVPLYVKKLNI